MLAFRLVCSCSLCSSYSAVLTAHQTQISRPKQLQILQQPAELSAQRSKMPNPESPLSASTYIWRVQPDQVGQRLDRYLVAQLASISRTGVQQLITDKAVLVNGKPGKAGYLLRLNDEVQALWTVPTVQQHDVKPQVLPLDVIYEDADLLIINKAAGMVVH